MTRTQLLSLIAWFRSDLPCSYRLDSSCSLSGEPQKRVIHFGLDLRMAFTPPAPSQPDMNARLTLSVLIEPATLLPPQPPLFISQDFADYRVKSLFLQKTTEESFGSQTLEFFFSVLIFSLFL